MANLFISYSRVNLEIVQKLREDLQNAGIDIWIDQVGLTPGTPDWDQALRDAIREASAVLLVASPDSRRSPYVRDEVAIAKDAKKPIYPLWVAGESWIDCIPMGLGSTQNVDLRGGAYSTNLPRLIGSLGGETSIEGEPVLPVTPNDEPEAPQVAEPRNPYKGLRAFQTEDQQDFFGRDTLIDEFLTIVDDEKRPARLLAVLGASGSGKSSVMMAGILPRLKQEHTDWTFLDPIVLGTNPIEKLTIMLARQFENKSQTVIEDDLKNRNTRGLHRVTSELSDKPVILYIDQFEEIFTLVDKEAERRHFIDILTTAVTEPDGVLYLLLSMRADFYGRPAQYREFGTLIEKHHVLITPMTLADLYDVLQKPAQLPDVGVTFEDGLVTEMVFAVREETAALPLLQFTLDQLFEARDGHTLTLQAYRDLGGIQGALAGHADATYDKLPSDQHRNLTRTLFLRLIEPGQTEQDTTRRRATYSELTLPNVEQTRILQETAESFVNARLLVTNQSSDERTIEVSHEALIREWTRLGDWLHDAREDLRLQKSLSADVAEWQRRGKPTDMLYRGTILSDAQVWAERNSASRDETMFFNESQRSEAERTRREAASRRNLRYAVFGLIGSIVVASVGLALILTRSNAELQAEAENLQSVASTAEYQSDYVQSQVNWLATRQFPIAPNELTQTPASAFFATATAQADLAANWEPVVEEFAGVAMAKVPAGCFWMGSNIGYIDETPIHEVCVDEFWIDLYEVTNQQYEQFDGSSQSEVQVQNPNQPLVAINWITAYEFCKLRSARLPNEAEWEYAARGPNNLTYPWGNEWNEDYAVWNIGGPYEIGEPAEVGSRSPESASWVGAYDMSGNAEEWTNSIFEPYPYTSDFGRENEDTDAEMRVIRGGAWDDNLLVLLRSAYRSKGPVTSTHFVFGFRCARS